MVNKIFILGDSRTGTTTIHKFLKLSGFNSIHYFFKESGVSDPAHVDFDNNWSKLQLFIDTGGYDAFSDYPIRTFYRQLFDAYPDANFILTTRKDVATWQRSMQNFFSKFKMDIDIEELTNAYNGVNEDIRKIAAQRGARLCDICIDDDAEHNGAMLSNFLSLDEAMSLGWENRTAAYDNALWSKRVTLFNTKSTDFLKYVKQITHPSKAMLSEYGWVYLINDSSDFMDYCYGQMIWGEERRKKATDTLVQRHSNLASQGIKYLKFIVPEKVIIYPQYLPRIFEGHEITENRPAVNLAAGCKEFISYPATLLKDACSYGHVYFRGDSHANWLGAFFLYHHIVEKLNNSLEATGHCQLMPHGLSDFDASLAAYAGDIFIQIDKEMRATFDGAWLPLNLSDDSIDKIEYLVRYTLSSSKRKAQKRPVEGDYLALLGDRETFRYSHPNKQLPRAVIFRDSTADYLVEPLAEHFSESLFIWHKGHVLSDVIEREKPDVVLHIMAERFVVQYDKFPIMATIGI